MSANVYTIENLLVGKTYRSKSVTGEIISAEKSDVGIKIARVIVFRFALTIPQYLI